MKMTDLAFEIASRAILHIYQCSYAQETILLKPKHQELHREGICFTTTCWINEGSYTMMQT